MIRSAMARIVALALAGGGLLAAPADAAELTTDQRCYVEGTPVEMSAAGFAPRTPLTVAIDGRVLRYADGTLPATDEAGVFANRFTAPSAAADEPEAVQRHVVLTADDGAAKARTRFTITRAPGADLAPSEGDPKTLRARFRVWGFALQDAPGRMVHAHWLRPDGRWRASAAIGTVRGPCGHMRSPLRRVVPFAAEPGRWTIVLDTRRRYRANADGPRAKIRLTIDALKR